MTGSFGLEFLTIDAITLLISWNGNVAIFDHVVRLDSQLEVFALQMDMMKLWTAGNTHDSLMKSSIIRCLIKPLISRPS